MNSRGSKYLSCCNAGDGLIGKKPEKQRLKLSCRKPIKVGDTDSGAALYGGVSCKVSNGQIIWSKDIIKRMNKENYAQNLDI